MSDQQTWVEALNINPEKLAQWSAEAPEGKPILVHCIEQGYLEYGEYMRWAQGQFGLAVLQPHFFQGAFDSSELEKVKNNGEWQPWIFPVQQWEGITFVACVEPPSERAENVRFVLADPRAMSEVWGGHSLPQEVAATERPDIGAEMPEGLAPDAKPFVLDLDNATFNIGPATEIKAMPTEAPPVQAAPELKIVPPTPAAAPPAPVIATKRIQPQPKGSPQEEAAIGELFSSLCERFQNAFIMKVDDQHARLYKWDSNLSPVDLEKSVVNLSYPTFLRIVSRTGQPYHGYLVDSPAHKELFANLGYPNLPSSITALPVKFESHLWGFVIAIGQQEDQKMESLTFAQETVEKLLNIVYDTWSKAA